jgi:hypothetical protein
MRSLVRFGELLCNKCAIRVDQWRARDLRRCAGLNPGQGTNQKGTGATSSFATRTRDQRGVSSSHNSLDSPQPLAENGGLVIT